MTQSAPFVQDAVGGRGISRRELLRIGASTAGLGLLAPGLACRPELTSPRPWVWIGALQPRSVQVNARVLGDPAPVLEVGPVDGTASSLRRLEPDRIGPSGVAAFELRDLAPGTAYAFRVGGMVGDLRTPEDEPFSYRVAFASCADTGSDHPVFGAIRARAPLFFIHMGDLHYRDIDDDDRTRFLRAYDEALSTPAQARFFRTTPVAYVWDDHDYGPDNADRTADSREAASSAFREVVPHYPLALSGDEAPIARAFTIGRVRYVLTDARSARSPRSHSQPTLLGQEQKRWLLDELSRASANHTLVVWVSPVPWIASGDDTWGGYPGERREIADHIVREGIDNLVMLSGDAHMLAIDDGRHNTFASDGAGPGFPVFHAAALDRSGSVKGGPYSHGAFPGGGQFGEMDIQDDGVGPVRMIWRGRNARGQVLVELVQTFPRPRPS